MARRKVKRVVEYYTEDSNLGEITQTKSIISASNEIGVDPKAKPPEMANLWEFPEDHRGDIRYLVTMDVAVIRNGISFRAKTINISASGALLDKSIPGALVNQTFEIMITYKETINGQTVQHIFPIMAKALGSPFRTPRIQFIGKGNPVLIKLGELIKKFKAL